MVLPIIGAAIGGIIAAKGASNAAKSQERAAENAADSQERIANQQIDFARETQDEITNRLQPYRATGYHANNALSNELLGGFNYQQPEFTYDAVPVDQFRTDPGYEFALKEGQRAIDGSAAARGMTFSGATLKAQQEYGQGLADQQFNTFRNDYRNRQANSQNDFRTEQTNYLNRLTNLSNSGQNAAAQTANAATNASQTASNALANLGSAQQAAAYNAGNASAAGSIGFGNAFNTGINNALGAYQYSQQAAGNNPITASQNLLGGSTWTGLY